MPNIKTENAVLGVFECGFYPGKLGESLLLVGSWPLKSDPCSILCIPLTLVPLGLAEVSQQTLALIDSFIQQLFIKHALFLRFQNRHWYPRKLRFLEKMKLFLFVSSKALQNIWHIIVPK